MRILITAMVETRPGPWDTVLLVGAGIGAQLPLLRRLEPRRLLLAEPQPEQRALLARVADPGRGEEVLDIALTDGHGPEATLQLCSNPAFTSLAAPTQLLKILPNLRGAGELQVPAKALHVLAAERGLDGSQRNLLVVDAPGQLALLADAAGLAAFTDIVVKAGSEPLYETDTAVPELEASLARAGFELTGADPEAIYPFEIHAYRRNDARLDLEKARQTHAKAVAMLQSGLQAAREQTAGLKAELDRSLASHRTELAATAEAHAAEKTRALLALQSELEAARGQATDLKAELDRSLASHRTELAATAEAHVAELAAQAKEHDSLQAESLKRLDAEKAQSLAALQSELGTVREQAAGLKAELDRSLASHRTELAATAEAHVAELAAQAKAHMEGLATQEREKAELTRALEARTGERDGAAGKSEEQRKQLEHLKERLNSLDGQLLSTRDAMALAVRMQTLRENDLEEMRQRYSELHAAHQAQRALLAKLSHRLVAANEYFQQLAGSGMLAVEAKSRRRKAIGKAEERQP